MTAINWLHQRRQDLGSTLQEQDKDNVNNFFVIIGLSNDKNHRVLNQIKTDLNKLYDNSLKLSQVVDKVQELYDEISKKLEEKERTQRNYGYASSIAVGARRLGQFAIAGAGSNLVFPTIISFAAISPPVLLGLGIASSVIGAATAKTCLPIKEGLEQRTREVFDAIVAQETPIVTNMLYIPQSRKIGSSNISSGIWTEMSKRLSRKYGHLDGAIECITSLGKGLYLLTDDFERVYDFANKVLIELKNEKNNLAELELENLNSASITATAVATNLLDKGTYTDLMPLLSK